MKKFKKLLISGLLAFTMITAASCGGGGGDESQQATSGDKYKIVISCQTEMGEEEVLRVLKAAYEKKNPDVEIEIKTFSGDGFEQYMLGIAANQSSSPNIIWTCDTLHSQWDEYFTDLRPYYEQSAETDYSLFYETMLDMAATHGEFKPTKNYTNPLGAFDREKDANSDGKEDYKHHSEHGIYYAPRDYNKPAILCNTELFKELDAAYEKLYKEVTGETEMPSDYKTTHAMLYEIINGEAEWDSMDDLYAFARLIAERVVYMQLNSDKRVGQRWKQVAALNLFLEWEPTYTTVLNAYGADIINDDGTLNLRAHTQVFQDFHDTIYPAEYVVENKDGESVEAAEILSKAMITSNESGVSFSSGNLFMNVCSRPVVLGYNNTLSKIYGTECLDTVKFPVADIAAGNSGYAISNIWEGQGMTVNGVYKSYTDLSWDFIKFIITEEGQEAAGKTGLNIPVLKKLYSADTNGGVVPEWRKVESLGGMSHDAWVAGGELAMKEYNIFQAKSRASFRNTVRAFFVNLQKSNYNDGSLEQLIAKTESSYALLYPADKIRK